MAKSKTPGQLSLFDTSWYERARSHYDMEDGDSGLSVIESSLPPVTPVIESSPDSITNQDNDSITTNPCGAIGKYRAGGNTRGNGEYWRFSYRDGRRVKHVHIPGGCCSNPIASARADKIREVINLGATVEQVLKLIQNW
jgi:hypothetical protein